MKHRKKIPNFTHFSPAKINSITDIIYLLYFFKRSVYFSTPGKFQDRWFVVDIIICYFNACTIKETSNNKFLLAEISALKCFFQQSLGLISMWSKIIQWKSQLKFNLASYYFYHLIINYFDVTTFIIYSPYQ